MTSPNIIYIMLDEWGFFEWSAMGHPILQTPNIDKMASEGIRFTHLPRCSKIRAMPPHIWVSGIWVEKPSPVLRQSTNSVLRTIGICGTAVTGRNSG